MRQMRGLQMLVLDATKFVTLLLLSIICFAFSIACLSSIGLGMVLLSEQAATWSRTWQWDAVPLSALFSKVGLVPHLDPVWIQSGLEQLFALESGPVLIAAATSIWIISSSVLDQALKKWHPTARVF
jgi:hypothetical protein